MQPSWKVFVWVVPRGAQHGANLRGDGPTVPPELSTVPPDLSKSSGGTLGPGRNSPTGPRQFNGNCSVREGHGAVVGVSIEAWAVPGGSLKVLG